MLHLCGAISGGSPPCDLPEVQTPKIPAGLLGSDLAGGPGVLRDLHICELYEGGQILLRGDVSVYILCEHFLFHCCPASSKATKAWRWGEEPGGNRPSEESF